MDRQPRQRQRGIVARAAESGRNAWHWPDIALYRMNTMQLKIKVSKSEYAEAVVHFRKKLYTALAEVENALSRRAQLIEAAAHQAQIAFQASQAEQQTHARFNAGAADLQAWLEAQGGLRKARDALKQNRLD